MAIPSPTSCRTPRQPIEDTAESMESTTSGTSCGFDHPPEWPIAAPQKGKGLSFDGKPLRELVPMTGIELVTYALRVRCSTN